jgi:hypothetical protein
MKKSLLILVLVLLFALAACAENAKSTEEVKVEPPSISEEIVVADDQEVVEQENDEAAIPDNESATDETIGEVVLPATLDDQQYVNYVTMTSSYGEGLMFPCIRGEEAVSETDHVTYKNSGVTMDIQLSDKSEDAESILSDASGGLTAAETDGMMYARSGDTVYIVDGTADTFTALYTIEADVYADVAVFDSILGLFGIEGGLAA